MRVRTAAAHRSHHLQFERDAETAEAATLRVGARFMLGIAVALPTTVTFLGLTAVVVLGRSVAALAARALVADRSQRDPGGEPLRARRSGTLQETNGSMKSRRRAPEGFIRA
jgi:hypothetical protein